MVRHNVMKHSNYLYLFKRKEKSLQIFLDLESFIIRPMCFNSTAPEDSKWSIEIYQKTSFLHKFIYINFRAESLVALLELCNCFSLLNGRLPNQKCVSFQTLKFETKVKVSDTNLCASYNLDKLWPNFPTL